MNQEDVWLKEGYVIYLDDPYSGFYRVVRKEPFQYTTGEENSTLFSTTTASGAQSSFINIDPLEPDNNPFHLFQVLWGVADTGDVKYYLKIPAGQNRLGIDEDKEIGYINAETSPWYDPNPTFQFWLHNDLVPAISCKNGSAVAITPKIWFVGMKYDLEAVKDQATLQSLSAGRTPAKKVVFGGVKNTP